MTIDPKRVRAAEIRTRMMELANERGPSRAVDPMEVAVAIAGKDEKVWRRLMKPIKEEAKRLAAAGSIVLMRKGKPTDPETVRGLWRFRLLAEGEAPPVFDRAGPAAPAGDDPEDDGFVFDEDVDED